MEEEIDLRPYIEAIIKYWYWILGAAVLAGLVAFGASSLLPPNYEATALVAVTVPQEWTFRSLTQDTLAPSFIASDDANPYLRAFPELARSDQLLQELLHTFQPPLEDISSVEELKEIIEAESGSDPTLIRLTVTYRDPEVAAELANNWAALYVPWVNKVYEQEEERVAILEVQLSNVHSKLETAEDALVAFEANNRASILENQKTSLTQRQADLLAEQNNLQSLTQDIMALETQIETLSNNDPVSLAHQLTALNLQLRAFNAQNDTPLQMQFESSVELTGENRTEQLAFLSSLLEIVAIRFDQIEEDLARLEPQILSLQQQQQEAETQHNRLTRSYDEAEEMYIALARNVESERLSIEDTTAGVRLVGLAILPSEPVGRGRLLTTIIFALIGALIAVSIVVIRAWMSQTAD